MSSGLSAIPHSTYRLEAVAIAGIVMASLIALVMFRYVVNFLIDVLILGDFRSLWQIGKCLRRVCPWYHPRTQPTEEPFAELRRNIRQRGAGEWRDEWDRTEVKTNLDYLLPHKILSKADILKMKTGEVRCDGTCSICLVDFEIGDNAVVEQNCVTTYHQKCLMEWILQGPSINANCPNCRAQLISIESLATVSV